MDQIDKKDIYSRIYDIVLKVPAGRVTTYGAIAEIIGMKSSARMVGWALNAVAGRTDIPCHRVVNRIGELSGKMHFATPTLMRELLETEGVTFTKDAVNMEKHFWHPNID
jgi:methylated-DNA-protein-cysteine methyltransferase related protein